MIKNYRRELPIFQFHGLQKFSDQVEHGVLSRLGGVSNKPFDSLNISLTVDDSSDDVLINRKIVCDSFGLDEKNLISANQVHGKKVVVIDETAALNHETNRDIDNADGFITAVPGVALVMKIADCQAILMFDPVRKVAAAVHAGWRGLAKDISGEAIALMKKKFGVKPEHLVVGVSPSIGPCCCFFSDPRKELSRDFEPYINMNNTVDLWSFSTDQLKKHGVQSDHIEHARVCTMCGGGEKFYSFRRDRGVTGRFGTLIFLR
jgi:hypothetical protein